MIISYNWLKKYIKDLPEPEKVAEGLIEHAFEIEGIEQKGDDFLIDVDVLPNRAHDCLGHLGIAKEIATIFNLPHPKINFEINEKLLTEDFSKEIKIKTEGCKRMIACKIENILIQESPKEIKDKLEAMGQKSINNVVDITNIVMYELGQPTHAFDADLIKGNIDIRNAKDGERVITLDNKELELNESIMVIADEEAPLDIAGIKGGKKAELTEDSNSIILTAGSFDASTVRKATVKINVRTDASKRFENDLHPTLAMRGLARIIELIKKYASTDATRFSKIKDQFPKPPQPYLVGTSLDEINKKLGIKLSEKEVEKIFDRFGFNWRKVNPHEEVLKKAKELVGAKYKWGASPAFDAPSEFDCSSFIAYVYRFAGFNTLENIDRDQFSIDQFLYANKIEEKDLIPGDLIFSNTQVLIHKIDYKSENFLSGTPIDHGVDHVGIYVGDKKLIHATSQDEKGVIEEKISDTNRFDGKIVGYGRFVDPGVQRYVIEVPDERVDLRITEDLIEEIGRIYGYDNIAESDVSEIKTETKINKEYAINKKIKSKLVELGFSEVYTYVFRNKGDIKAAKPVASDKGFLRTNLSDGISEALDLNEYNLDLLGQKNILIFEIGRVFPKEGEKLKLCLGVRLGKGQKKTLADEILKSAVESLNELIENPEFKVQNSENGIVEFDLGEIVEKSPEQKDYVDFPDLEKVEYKIPSQYPFISRDISVWIPSGEGDENTIFKIVEKHAGDLLKTKTLFDIFEKDGRTSYAVRVVFQSDEKTLTDDEIEVIMNKVYDDLSNKDGFEIR